MTHFQLLSFSVAIHVTFLNSDPEVEGFEHTVTILSFVDQRQGANRGLNYNPQRKYK